MNHFAEFKNRIKEQPWLFTTVERVTIQFINAGYKGMSMDYVINSIRWNPNIPKVGIPQGEEFAIPNSFRSYLTRMFLYVHPEHRHLFTLTLNRDADRVTPDQWNEVLGLVRPNRIPQKQLSIFI